MNPDQDKVAESQFLTTITYKATREGAAKELRREEMNARQATKNHLNQGKYDLACKYLKRAQHFADAAEPLEQGAATVRIEDERVGPC